MSIDARLNKLMPALSARERAILLLRSLKDKTPEDPLWRRTMPQEQTREFNRLIVLMNACNIYLPLYITVVEQKAEQMNLRLTLIRTITQFGSALWHLGALVPAAKHKKAQQVVEGRLPDHRAALGRRRTRVLLAQHRRADGRDAQASRPLPLRGPAGHRHRGGAGRRRV